MPRRVSKSHTGTTTFYLFFFYRALGQDIIATRRRAIKSKTFTTLFKNESNVSTIKHVIQSSDISVITIMITIIWSSL